MGGVSSTLLDVKQQAKNIAEVTTLQAFGIPGPVVEWYQTERKALGFGTPTGVGLFGVAFVMYTLFTILLAVAVRIIFKVFGFIWRKRATRILLILLLLIFITYVLYYLFIKTDKKANQNVFTSAEQDFLGLFGVKKEGFQTSAEFPELNVSLMNLQPLAVKQVAFTGPHEKSGKFNIENGVQGQIKGGVRFLTFQIDYLDVKKDLTNFGNPGEPILLYRDDANALISVNSASISEVAKDLATYAFSEAVVNSTMPLIIYLHFVRTPDSIKEPKKYLDFLSRVAQGLEPLFPNLLVSVGEGMFNRQSQEKYLLQTAIGQMQKKVVYMTNVDTTLFRRTDLLGIEKPYENKYDLDYLTHLRIYADTPEDAKGITQVSTSPLPPFGVIVSYDRILALSAKDRDFFAKKGQERFVIAMPSQMKNPKSADLNKVLTTYGVNIVPLNIFGESMDELKKKMAIWKDNMFIHMKPVALQNASGAVSPA